MSSFGVFLYLCQVHVVAFLHYPCFISWVLGFKFVTFNTLYPLLLSQNILAQQPVRVEVVSWFGHAWLLLELKMVKVKMHLVSVCRKKFFYIYIIYCFETMLIVKNAIQIK